MKLLRRLWLLVMCLLAAMGLSAQQPNTVDNGLGSASPAASLKVPRLIKFSGMLRDLTGKPLAGPVDANFAIYKEQTDLVPLWYEAQTLQLDEQGRYTVLLGAMQAEGLPMALFTSGEARWLEVYVAGAEPQPRTLLVSVPYALKAGDAETLGGKPASAFVLAEQASTTAPSGVVPVATPSASEEAGADPHALTKPRAPAALTSGTANYIAKFTDAPDLGNSVMYESLAGNVGVGTTQPTSLFEIHKSTLGVPVEGAVLNIAGLADDGDYDGIRFGYDVGGSGYLKGGIFFERTGNYALGKIHFATDNTQDSSNVDLSDSRMVIDHLGNVGIGTTLPVSILEASKVAATYWNSSTNNWGGQVAPPQALTITNATPGGYDPVIIGRMTTSTGVSKPAFAIGAVGTSSWTDGYLASQIADIYFVNRDSSGNLQETMRIGSTGNVGIGTTVPGEKLEVAGNVKASGSVTAASFSGDGSGLTNLNASYVYGAISSTSSVGGVPGVTGTNAAAGRGVSGSGDVGVYGTGTTYGVEGESADTGVYGHASSGTGDTNGVYGLADSTAGTGVYGHASAGTGDTNGVYGLADSSDGVGVFGYASSATGLTDGVYGEAASTDGAGVYGYAGASSGETYGLYGEAESTSGTGVMGYALSAAGTTVGVAGKTGSAAGVAGLFDNLAGGNILIGQTNGSERFRVDGSGNLVASGSVTATSFSGGGTLSGTQLISTVAGGTAPLSVTSNTLVPNLNADLLDGFHAGAFQPAGAYATLGGNTFTATQSISSGDLSVSSGNISLPQTASASAGVVNLGGAPFIHACCSAAQHNTFLGANAGNFTTSGSNNFASGEGALAANTSGKENTANGTWALHSNTTGSYNNAIGNWALQYNTEGIHNTANGVAGFYNNTTGSFNTGNGYGVLYYNTTGSGNTGVGFEPLRDNCKGVASGCTGNNNTALGYLAGVTGTDANANVTGANNTFIGYQSGPGTSTQLTNATAIGANALVSASNALVLGGTGADAVNVGIGTAAPANILTVVQNSSTDPIADAWTTYSSRRWKANIQTLQGALGKVERLRGVSYDRKADGKHEIGVIAEEVGEVVPEVVAYEENGRDAKSVDYARLTALLIEAVKEQQAQISELKAQLEVLKAKLQSGVEMARR